MVLRDIIVLYNLRGDDFLGHISAIKHLQISGAAHYTPEKVLPGLDQRVLIVALTIYRPKTFIIVVVPAARARRIIYAGR